MKYGFLGCGNMGSAIAAAFSKHTTDIMLTDRSGKAFKLAQHIGCRYSDNLTIATTCDRIFLGVKPQMMEEVLKPLRPYLQDRKPLLISMAAGLSISKIEEFVGTALPVIRIMPNTPVAAGCGVILYCHNSLVDPEVLSDLLTDGVSCGIWDKIEESMIDAAGVVSGCGPAYMYMFMDALANAAVSCGVPFEKALKYASATMRGAAEMVEQTGLSPESLRDAVCSPGGSTIAGVRELNKNGFNESISACVTAAYKRNLELGK